ncbi:MAG: hypothetical protein OXI83_18355 [Gemmatimonadota bacterium]|nr:hypothetical protein [Gemmatimonadota bacterium]
MPGRSKSERAGWLALLVLVLTAALSAIACDESTSEAPPALAEAEPAQAEPADDPTAEPEQADAPEQLPRRAETSQSEAEEDEEESAPVEPEAEEAEPAAASASPPDDAAEQPPAAGAATSEAPEPAQDATAVEDEEPQPSELAVVVPDGPEAVTLYAGPAIDWAALATLEPGAPLTVIGRAPEPRGPEIVWLLAETPDGTRGWLTADDLALDPDALAVLRELQPSEMEVLTSVRDGAWIHRQPDHTSPGCELPEGGPAAVVGRSPDGDWSLVSLVQRGCQDPDEWYYGAGWIHGADLAEDPTLSRAPVVYPHGLWLFAVDPQIEPTKLPVCVYDGLRIEVWSFDPEDDSLVFADHCSSDDSGLKRYTPGTGDLTSLSSVASSHILVAPVGGRVLMMFREGWESPTPFPLTILHPDGQTEDIGYLNLSWGSGRWRLLQRQARWSPDGQTIIFRDYSFSEQPDPDYSDFWLYHVATGERVDLRRGTAAANLRLRDLHFDPDDQSFHPDGQSIYAFAWRSYPIGVLHRLTLEGDEWPGFTPIESVRWYRISPRGDRIIASVDGRGRIFTDQGELLGERAGGAFHWFPDGDTIAYPTAGGWHSDQEWTIEHLPSGRTNQLHLPGEPRWSPDGEHIAVVNWANSWSGHSTSDFYMVNQLRMYDASGELLSVHRFEGCYRYQWLPDGSQFALSVFPFYLCLGS